MFSWWVGRVNDSSLFNMFQMVYAWLSISLVGFIMVLFVFFFPIAIEVQSTLVISNSKELTETLRDIRTSTYQSWEGEENNNLSNHI